MRFIPVLALFLLVAKAGKSMRQRPGSTAPLISPVPSAAPSDEAAATNAVGMDSEDMDHSPEERSFGSRLHQQAVYMGLGVFVALAAVVVITQPQR